jgi:DNA polymerase-3 subunit epsilon
MPLTDLEVLVLDIQASGANPAHGHLMEIAWATVLASTDTETVEKTTRSYLVQLPEEIEVPRQVSRITGLKTEDLQSGLSEEQAWEKLLETVREIIAAGSLELCPTIIHFYRYEEAFLRHLHRHYSVDETFPFEIICTHQLARRLLPQLPGKSLRAIAGYFGFSVPELRRSVHHVSATAFIWQHAVRLLAQQGVGTLGELRRWLKEPRSPSKDSKRQFPMDPKVRAHLPHRPGVYRMLRSNGDLLYIGKATSLKKRVNSYFHKKKRSAQARLTMEMLTQAVQLDFTVTGSALEAALLESDQIKRHAPPYNVALRQREREIAFFSRDFAQSATKAGTGFPVGPLPSVHSLSAFSAIYALLKGELKIDNGEIDVCSYVLGIPPDYAPELECFWEGVKLFKEIHMEKLEACSSRLFFNSLMMLGKQLRQQKLEEMEQAALAEDEENEDEEITADIENDTESEVEEEERTWTPEAVAHVMEGIIRHGAHLIRRSRWFCLLSESALAWITGETAAQQRRVVVLHKGSVHLQEELAADAPVPLPPGCQTAFSSRQECFDVMTYDRLRVLTTELRRLASDQTDRQVQLRLSPDVILGSQQLLDLFRWV